MASALDAAADAGDDDVPIGAVVFLSLIHI